MSKVIDEKVVSLEFDNQNFEQNVKTSMSTLDKFKAKFNFKEASSGIEELERAANKVDFSSMNNGIGSLSLSFDSLEIIAIRALSNITDAAMKAGAQLIKSLSGTDLIKEGWSKYAEQTTAVQTIMSAVSGKINEATEKEYNLDDVMETVKRLGWYSDETSYSLEQMTSALGNFTSSGIDLKVSENALMGIANACADAGVNASSASHAFIGFSKAIGQGFVSQGIWTSFLKTSGITNSEKFKQSLIDSAVAAGTLKKTMEGVYITTSKAAKAGEKVTVADFTSALTTTKWLNSDVLLKTFKSYSDTIDALYGLVADGKLNKSADVIQTLTKAIEEQGKTLDDYGLDKEYVTTSEAVKALTKAYEELGLEVPKSLEAFKNAQVAVTFQQAIESVKTAVASGWATTFETMFGNLEQASDLWTTLANNLYEIFAEGGNTRNEILEAAFGSKWSSFNEAISEYGLTIEDFEEKFRAFVSDQNIDIDGLIKDYGSLENVLARSNIVNKNTILDFFESLSNTDESLQQLAINAKDAEGPLNDLLNSITRSTGRDLLANSINNICKAVISFKNIVGEKWSEVFDADVSEIIYNILVKFNDLTEAIANTIEESTLLQAIFKSLFSIVKVFNSLVSQLVRGSISILSKIFKNLNIDITEYTDKVSNALESFSDWIVENDAIFKLLDTAGEKISDLINIVKDWITEFSKLKAVQSILDGFKKSVDGITEGINGISSGKITLETISNAFKQFKMDVQNGTVDPMEMFSNNLEKMMNNLGGFASTISDSIKTIFSNITNPINISSESLNKFSGIIKSTVETLIGLAAGGFIIKGIYNLTDAFAKLLTPLYTVSDFIKAWAGVGNSISGYFKALTGNQTANNIVKIALAISVLAGVLYVLAKIDSDALWNSIGAMGAIIGMITAMAIAFSLMPRIETGTNNIGKVMLSLAASVAILAIALNSIDDVDNLLEDVAAIIILMSGLVAMCELISKNKSQVSISAGVLLSLSTSVLIMSFALKSISKLNWNELEKGILGFASVIIGLVAVLVAMSKVPALSSAGVQLLAMSLSILLIINSLQKLASIDSETYYKGLIMLIPIFGAYTLLMRAVQSAGASSVGASAYIISISISLLLMAKAIENFGSMNNSTLMKGTLIASTLMIVFSSIMSLFSVVSKSMGTLSQMAGLSLMMLGMAASLYLMAGVILIFKNMDTEGLWKAVSAIAVLEIAFGAMAWLMKSTTFNANSAKSLAMMAVIIAVLAGSVLVLSLIDTEKVIVNTLAIISIMAGLSLLVTALNLISGNVKTALVGAVLVGLLLAATVAAIYILSTINTNNMLEIVTSLCSVLISLSIACAILAAAGAIAASAMAGVWGILGVLGAISAILLVVGEIVNLIPGSSENLDKVIDILGKIGEAIGSFFGGIIGGIAGKAAETLTSYLPAVGESLSAFANNIKDFLSLEIAEGFEDTINTLINLVVSMANLNFINSLKRISENAEYLSQLKEFFTNYADIIVDFSNKISGKIDTASVEAAANAGSMMASLYDSLPKTGGIVSTWFSGEKDLGKFGEDINTFAEALVGVSETMGSGKFDSKAVDVAYDAGKMLSELANAIPTTGGLLSDLIGSQNLGSFGDQIAQFTKGLVEMSDTLSEGSFDSSTVDLAKSAGDTFVALANSIPEQGSLKTWLLGGDKNLGRFGDNIKEFAAGLVYMVAILTGKSISGDEQYPKITLEDANSALEVVNTISDVMVALANSIPEQGGLFSGEGKNLGSFGAQLSTFGYGIASFSRSIASIETYPDQNKLDSITLAVQSMASLATSDILGIFESEGPLERIGTAMKHFGQNINIFNDNIANYNSELVDYILEDIASFININSENNIVVETIVSDFEYLKSLLVQKIFELKQYLKLAIESTMSELVLAMNVKDKAFESGRSTLQGLLDGLTDSGLLASIWNAGVNAAETFNEAYRSHLDINSPSRVMVKNGKYTIQGLILGIASQMTNIKEAGNKAGETLLNSLQTSIEEAEAISSSTLNPVITPVLDLSTIQDQANQLNGMFPTQTVGSATAISKIQNGAKLASGSNNSFNVNIDFTVNNAGKDLTDVDVSRFSKLIVNRINEELGALV